MRKVNKMIIHSILCMTILFGAVFCTGCSSDNGSTDNGSVKAQQVGLQYVKENTPNTSAVNISDVSVGTDETTKEVFKCEYVFTAKVLTEDKSGTQKVTKWIVCMDKNYKVVDQNITSMPNYE